LLFRCWFADDQVKVMQHTGLVEIGAPAQDYYQSDWNS
jgi:hypothetical protein